MKLEEKTMKSDRIYEGKIINLRVDTVEITGKKYSKREIVEHPGATAIVPIIEGEKVVLVRQYRKAVESFILEIPAGKIDANEEPKQTAIRELKEETGYYGDDFKYLTEIYTSPGFSNEKIYIFIAENLKEGEACPDSNENIDIEIYSIDECLKFIDRGEIIDSKTVVGILMAKEYLNNKKER